MLGCSSCQSPKLSPNFFPEANDDVTEDEIVTFSTAVRVRFLYVADRILCCVLVARLALWCACLMVCLPYGVPALWCETSLLPGREGAGDARFGWAYLVNLRGRWSQQQQQQLPISHAVSDHLPHATKKDRMLQTAGLLRRCYLPGTDL